MATKSKTTDTEVIEAELVSEDGLAVVDNRLDAFNMAAAGMMPTGGGDGFDIVASLMEAQSLDDILGSDVIGLKTRLMQPFTISQAELRKSDYADGLGVYLILHVDFDANIRGDVESAVLSCGSATVVAQVVRMNQLGYIPGARTQCREADKPTEAGYYPLRLIQPPKAIEAF